MTGKTFLACRFDRVPQRDKGLMRIGMALQTVFDLEMRLSCMAKGAGGYRIFPFRRVLGMTVETSDFCGVFTAFSGNRLKLRHMTLTTIPLLQHCCRFCSKRDRADQKKEKYQTTAMYCT